MAGVWRPAADGAALGDGGVQDGQIGSAAEALGSHRLDIVSGHSDLLRPSPTEILVELQLHATSTKWPAASRAP